MSDNQIIQSSMVQEPTASASEGSQLMAIMRAMGPACIAAAKTENNIVAQPMQQMDAKDFNKILQNQMAIFDTRTFSAADISPNEQPTLAGVAMDLRVLQGQFNLLFQGMMSFFEGNKKGGGFG